MPLAVSRGGANTASSSPSCNRRSNPRALPSDNCKSTIGKRCLNGSRKCGRKYGPRLIGKPSFNSPPKALCPPRAISCRRSAPSNKVSICLSSSWPAPVTPILRPPRSNKGTPSACSTFCT
ncbi:hypothetical protein RF55_20122 [Lasius niger]|uniref:Uncharacterized protein n=1 Tax=Lasius niger TaxID=67767 RepID=A0A0J7JZD1_LASNI|nr:hypothetical protein RF55_20122 [Lasius niger]